MTKRTDQIKKEKKIGSSSSMTTEEIPEELLDTKNNENQDKENAYDEK